MLPECIGIPSKHIPIQSKKIVYFQWVFVYYFTFVYFFTIAYFFKFVCCFKFAYFSTFVYFLKFAYFFTFVCFFKFAYFLKFVYFSTFAYFFKFRYFFTFVYFFKSCTFLRLFTFFNLCIFILWNTPLHFYAFCYSYFRAFVDIFTFVQSDLAKSRSAKGASRPIAFMGNCPTISYTCLPYLATWWVHLFVSGATKGNEDAGWIQAFIFFVSGVNQGNEKVEWVQDPLA